MTFHIKDVPDDHTIWWAVENTVTNTVLAVCPWLIQYTTIENEDEYVHGLAAASDFLYALSNLGRLREKGEVHTIDYHVMIDEYIANDEVVRKAYHKCVNEYRYSAPSFSDDPDDFEDVHLNKLCVKRVYATLMNLGFVTYYERQEHTVTTKQIKV
jgi:hypothetical protein